MDLTRPSLADDAPVPARPHASPPDETGLDAVFPGASAMAARCRAFDWASTPLGPVERWSASLRATVGMVLTSRQPMFLFWGPELVQLHNDAYRPSLGVGGRAERALGARGREFWTDIWDTIGPQIEQVMGGGEATWHEDQYLPIERNGRLEDVWWTYSYSPVRDDDGRVAATLVVCQETTSRVRAERDLALAHATLASERARLGEIVDRAPAFIAVLRGADHRFERFNAEYQKLVGGRARVGLTVEQALPEAREQGFIALLDGVLATGEAFVARGLPVSIQRAPDGPPELRHLDLLYQALTEADGTRSGVFVHGVDVTEAFIARRAAERATERLARLQRVAVALEGAVLPDELAVAVVRAATPAVGASVAAVTRLSDDGCDFLLTASYGLPEETKERLARFPNAPPSPVAESLATRTPLFQATAEEYEARCPALAELRRCANAEATATLPLIVGGEPYAVLSFGFPEAQEFTSEDREFLIAVASQCAQALERARLFEAERHAREEAEAANRAKAEFLATMSHELRTPLNAIGGYAELMEMGIRGPVTAQQAEDLRRVQASQRHLLGLINEVLNYAKLETGTVHYDLADVQLYGALVDAEALVAPQAQAKGLALEVRPCAPALLVRADAEKLRQVLVNLLSNAIKFTDRGGRVELECAASGRTMQVVVRDTGIGIATEQQGRIFEPFVQVRADLTRTAEGTGLGLAISRDLARGMGGDLTVESAPGTGSTFTLVLPRAGAP